MTRFTHYWLSKPLLLGLLLAALTLRGLIPVGYMPSSEQPFALQMCQVELSSNSAHADDAVFGVDAQSHTDADSTLCIFGATPSAAPVPELPLSGVTLVEIPTLSVFDVLPPFESRRDSVHQPRAPPAFS